MGDVEGVLVRPLLAAFQEADPVLIKVQVIPGCPFVHYLAGRCDFPHHVAQHTPALAVIVAALNLLRDFLGDQFPRQSQGVAVGEALEVVVQRRVSVFPDHVAVPVQLQDGAGHRATAPGQHLRGRMLQERNFLPGRTGAQQQVAVGQQVRVRNPLVRMPSVADAALHVDEPGFVAVEVGDQGVAPVRLLGVVVNQTVRMLVGPTHAFPPLLQTLQVGIV